MYNTREIDDLYGAYQSSTSSSSSSYYTLSSYHGSPDVYKGANSSHPYHSSSSYHSPSSYHSSSAYHSSSPYTSSSQDTVAERAYYGAAEREEVPKYRTMGDPGDRLRRPGDADDNGDENEGDKVGGHRSSTGRHKKDLKKYRRDHNHKGR
jgi:hypothetical protein